MISLFFICANGAGGDGARLLYARDPSATPEACQDDENKANFLLGEYYSSRDIKGICRKNSVARWCNDSSFAAIKALCGASCWSTEDECIANNDAAVENLGSWMKRRRKNMDILVETEDGDKYEFSPEEWDYQLSIRKLTEPKSIYGVDVDGLTIYPTTCEEMVCHSDWVALCPQKCKGILANQGEDEVSVTKSEPPANTDTIRSSSDGDQETEEEKPLGCGSGGRRLATSAEPLQI